MKKNYRRKNMAVAPVLATLLMIAVAVAMSVIIFMWSQGFLAGTSDSTGSQQGSQNQAAQSSISIETATFSVGSTSNITTIVRNVGAVAVSLGSISVTGISSNAGFSGSVIGTVTSGALPDANLIETSNTWQGSMTTDTLSSIAKGAGVVISIGATTSSGDTKLAAGDVITIKITTDKGTFAQQTFTVG